MAIELEDAKLGMRWLKDLLAKLRDYRSSSDPLVALANTVALVIAGNQPFYPLYLHFIAGPAAWPAWLTLLTTPVFALIPAVARQSSLAGRALLPVIGTVNGILAVKAIGVDTGVELFLLPCILLAACLFRREECAVMFAVLALPFFAYFIADTAVGTSLATFSATEYRSIIAMHGFSVACLFALIGFNLRSPELERR